MFASANSAYKQTNQKQNPNVFQYSLVMCLPCIQIHLGYIKIQPETKKSSGKVNLVKLGLNTMNSRSLQTGGSERDTQNIQAVCVLGIVDLR